MRLIFPSVLVRHQVSDYLSHAQTHSFCPHHNGLQRRSTVCSILIVFLNLHVGFVHQLGNWSKICCGLCESAAPVGGGVCSVSAGGMKQVKLAPIYLLPSAQTWVSSVMKTKVMIVFCSGASPPNHTKCLKARASTRHGAATTVLHSRRCVCGDVQYLLSVKHRTKHVLNVLRHLCP